jgi:uracil-DNA glycosylase family 4
LEPERSPTETSPEADRRELASLCSALRAQLELLAASGAWGLPPSLLTAPRRSAATAVPPPGQIIAPGAPRGAAPSAAINVAAGAPPPSAAHASLPLAPVAARLAQLAEEVKACTRCPLHRERTQTVFARGTGSSGVLFLGEGPGEEEDRQGAPFVGPAGQLLDRMIAAMKLARDEVYVCNIVKCRPPRNRKPDPDEMNHCRPYLEEQVSLLQPRVIVALGATAVQGLLGTTEGITRLRGQWKLYRGLVPVMPTFHPAYLLRQPQAKREVWDDLREVLRHLEHNRPAQ